MSVPVGVSASDVAGLAGATPLAYMRSLGAALDISCLRAVLLDLVKVVRLTHPSHLTAATTFLVADFTGFFLGITTVRMPFDILVETFDGSISSGTGILR